jgi:hypothetical protein
MPDETAISMRPIGRTQAAALGAGERRLPGADDAVPAVKWAGPRPIMTA